MKLYEELKRRNVIRVMSAYLVISWGVLKVVAVLVGVLDLPDWTDNMVLAVLIVGLVPTLIAAWALELTPDGLKFEQDVDRSKTESAAKRHPLDYVIVGVLILIIAGMVVERTFFPRVIEAEPIASTAATDRSVAILPFADLSREQDQVWFADGLAEEILNALARTPDIRVSSRTSALAYRGTDKDAPTIARELNVAHVLEGSIRRSASRIRITAQLIRGEDDAHLWSQTYDADAEDIIAVQEDVALQIAMALQTTMDPRALEDMMQVGTRSVRAYQAYILGKALQARALRTGESDLVTDAYEQFEDARRIDPQFAAAHRAAADYWKVRLNPTRGPALNGELTASEMLDQFMTRVDLAVDTANNEADRSGSRAQRATVQLRLRNAIRRFNEYLEVRPNDYRAWYELLVVAQLATDSATIKKALEVLRTGGDHDRFPATTYLSNAYRFHSASSVADKGLTWLKRWPNDAALSYQTHRALLWAGRIGDAANLLERMPESMSQNRLLRARQACAEGREDDAKVILEELRSTGNRDVATEWMLLMLLDQRQEAIDLLRDYETGGVPYQLASWLVLNIFDPEPYPSLVQMLKREDVQRPPVSAIPFACRAN